METIINHSNVGLQSKLKMTSSNYHWSYETVNITIRRKNNKSNDQVNKIVWLSFTIYILIRIQKQVKQ